MPSELDDVRRRIMQLEIEEMALKKEDDPLSGRLQKLVEELANAKEKFNEMKSRWENEKNSVDEVKNIKSEIERVNGEIENAQMNLEYEKARSSNTRPAGPAAKAGGRRVPRDRERENPCPRHGNREQIAASSPKGRASPSARIMEGEREKILHLDEVIHKRVVGQAEPSAS
jgi:ATP-dependent Clp protease ATP-binding subunit ClpB